MNEADVPELGLWVPDVVDGLLRLERAVPLYEFARESGLLQSMSTSLLKQLCTSLRSQGYLLRAAEVLDVLRARDDAAVEGLERSLTGELAVLRGDSALEVASLQMTYVPREGRVLSIVELSLPMTDSNSTRQTHEFALQGVRYGVEISVVTQMGIGEPTGYDVEEIDDIQYHRIPGPSRGSVPFDEWLSLYATRLASVVRKLRPGLLVASSDFVNGMAAKAVAKAYGIPFVYDLGSVWEDAWLRQKVEQHSWTEDQVPDRWGYPDLWSLRREREGDVIGEADAVVVRTSELNEHVLELGLRREGVNLVAGVDSPKWAELLQQTGTISAGAADLATTEYGSDDLVRLIGGAERRPLGKVETFAARGSAEVIREEGWRHASLDPVKISVPFDWVYACRDHRSQAFHLHAWDFMVPFLMAWHKDRDRDALQWCLERAADWAATFNEGLSRGTMAWYDMAIGLRAPRLAYLVQEAVHEGVASTIIDTLTLSVIQHQRHIFSARAFNANTNHGFYTAVGELSFAKRLLTLPGMSVVEEQGHQRLRRVVSTQFAEDGGHLEHSPDYHRMLVSSFLGAIQDGLLDDGEVARRIERAGEVMGWFLRPDRSIVQIGDSPARLVTRVDREMAAPHTVFLVTEGKGGEPNPEEMLVLPDSGYAIVRSPQPKGRDDHLDAGYLTFMAGFHSRTHKHCDDLSITWFDGGQELLIDSGRFGYLDQLPTNSPLRDEGFFYARPERQYVERTMAHNTAEADGRDQERVRRAPYGSALVGGQQEHDRFRLIGEVNHGAWSHRRSITYLPGAWLLVEDALQALDGNPHDFRLWWNLPEELRDPSVEGGRVTFLLPDGRPLYVSALRETDVVPPAKGQRNPLRGWRSKMDEEFTPAWSLAHEGRKKERHVFLTLLSLDQLPTQELLDELVPNVRGQA